MKTWIAPVAAAALSLFAPAAWAATYTLTAPTYSGVTPATTLPCAPQGTCTDFTTSEKVTGAFTTAAPLSANLSDVNIGGLLTAYSFNDGVTTYASTDAQSRKKYFRVTTDATGTITAYRIELNRWQVAGPHTLNPSGGPAPANSGAPTDRFDFIIMDSANADGFGARIDVRNNRSCWTGIITSQAGDADTCDGSDDVSGQSPGALSSPGTFAGPPAIVPTLSEWAMIALGASLAALALLSRRRQSA